MSSRQQIKPTRTYWIAPEANSQANSSEQQEQSEIQTGVSMNTDNNCISSKQEHASTLQMVEIYKKAARCTHRTTCAVLKREAETVNKRIRSMKVRMGEMGMQNKRRRIQPVVNANGDLIHDLRNDSFHGTISELTFSDSNSPCEEAYVSAEERASVKNQANRMKYISNLLSNLERTQHLLANALADCAVNPSAYCPANNLA